MYGSFLTEFSNCLFAIDSGLSPLSGGATAAAITNTALGICILSNLTDVHR